MSASNPSALRVDPLVGIVGGEGLLGRWFAAFLRSKEVRVIVSDLNTSLTNQLLVERSDIVIISVPIRDTVRVIESIAEQIRSEQMLVDLTSLKSEPVAAMLKSRGEVLGLHPMFGPPIESIAGQTVVFCKARPGAYTAWFLKLLSGAGARLKESTPVEHDKTMAVIQVLNHISTIAVAGALKKVGVDIAESLSYASPVYRMRMDLIARMMAQDSGLYADMTFDNPYASEALRALETSTAEILAYIKDLKRDEFLTFFKEASEYLGAFRSEGLKESTKLINFLAGQK